MEHEQARVDAEKEALKAAEKLAFEAIDDAEKFLLGPFVLERAIGTRFRNSVIALDDKWCDVQKDAQLFVVAHKWPPILSAEDELADFRLPYNVCCFEFMISGRRIYSLWREDSEDNKKHVIAVAESNGINVTLGMAFMGSKNEDVRKGWQRLFDILKTQVMSICVALESEIAKSEVVREPHLSNAPPLTNAPAPGNEYHVVSLVNRRAVLPRSEGQPTGIHHRLHWCHGHYRHFATFKTWIKWHLRGNPDLGFIDKNYDV